MTDSQHAQWTIKKISYDDHVLEWCERFIMDRKISGVSTGTLYFYGKKLLLFSKYADPQLITLMGQIDANTIRNYLTWLEQTGHNPGGRHCAYRALKTFVRWWAAETEPENWRDPFARVKAPKLTVEPLEPVDYRIIRALIETCKNDHILTASRDKALILFLVDTGARASEAMAVNLNDLDLAAGSVLIRQGKGSKSRSVFLGKKCKLAIRAYLRIRTDSNPALWITEDNEGLTYWGLYSMLQRRSSQAGVKAPSPHDFRRAFALNMLRSGVDVYTIQKLMGHADLQVLRRYLAQDDNDLAIAHRSASPGDKV